VFVYVCLAGWFQLLFISTAAAQHNQVSSNAQSPKLQQVENVAYAIAIQQLQHRGRPRLAEELFSFRPWLGERGFKLESPDFLALCRWLHRHCFVWPQLP